MQDGSTRKLARSEADMALFLGRHRVTLIVLDGPSAGSEHEVTSQAVSLGRGPDVTIAFADDSMSRQHAALDLTGEGFRIRDLGSTNGIEVNGSAVNSADLKHGDKISLGTHTLQYIVEPRTSVPSYDLSGGA
jgi:pSer/pThr/pTyr-binding forkhead associated (FHA) protein